MSWKSKAKKSSENTGKNTNQSEKIPTVQIIGVKGLPVVNEKANIAKLVCDSAERQGTPLQDGDILVVSHIIVSRDEGNVVNLDSVVPSEFAKTVAQQFGKDPALVETILRESKGIVRMRDGKIITETKHGFICANAGVDKSNVPGKRNVALLPMDPDHSARKIRREIKMLTKTDVQVIISDTHGRPLRKGEINIAIGVAGIRPIRDRRGEKDLFGYVLKAKQTCIADELCSAAELVMGQADEAIPVAIIRGHKSPTSERAQATELLRPQEKDLFM